MHNRLKYMHFEITVGDFELDFEGKIEMKMVKKKGFSTKQFEAT